MDTIWILLGVALLLLVMLKFGDMVSSDYKHPFEEILEQDDNPYDDLLTEKLLDIVKWAGRTITEDNTCILSLRCKVDTVDIILQCEGEHPEHPEDLAAQLDGVYICITEHDSLLIANQMRFEMYGEPVPKEPVPTEEDIVNNARKQLLG